MPTPTYDMSAADTQRRPSNRYIEYLHLYSRRARKTATGPTADGAGLLCGTRYHGRNTPLKGKGVPPTDGKETPTMIGGLRIMSVPWHHHAETDVLNTRPRPATADGALGFRPSVRYFQTAFASSMQGGGAVVVEEEPEKRMVRRRGAQAPQDDITTTKRRVQIDSVEVGSCLAWWEAERPSSVRTWTLPSRPVTADSIIRHRYSDPSTEPSPAKLETSRAPAPTLSKPTAEASRAVFTSALDSYCATKARAMFGSQFRLD